MAYDFDKVLNRLKGISIRIKNKKPLRDNLLKILDLAEADLIGDEEDLKEAQEKTVWSIADLNYWYDSFMVFKKYQKDKDLQKDIKFYMDAIEESLKQ